MEKRSAPGVANAIVATRFLLYSPQVPLMPRPEKIASPMKHSRNSFVGSGLILCTLLVHHRFVSSIVFP
jgi:hypothetical protein